MITIDNGIQVVRPEDFGFRASLEHSVTHVSSTNHQTISIPGRKGLLLTKQQVGSKPFSVSFRRLDKSERIANEDTDRFLDILFDDWYEARLLKITMDYETDKYLNAYVVGDVTSARNAVISKMPLSFIAYDPQRYSKVFNDEVTWGSTELTFDSTYLLGHENTSANMSIIGQKTIDVQVIGLALQPRIELTGSATDLVISCNGKKIHVGTFTDATWVIDTEKYIAHVNGVEKMLRMDSFWLRQGSNKIGFTGTGIDLGVTIRFRDRFK